MPGTQPGTGAPPSPAHFQPDRPVPAYKATMQAAASLWPRNQQVARSQLQVLALVGCAGVKRGARTQRDPDSLYCEEENCRAVPLPPARSVVRSGWGLGYLLKPWTSDGIFLSLSFLI